VGNISAITGAARIEGWRYHYGSDPRLDAMKRSLPMRRRALAILCSLGLVGVTALYAPPASAQQVTRETVPGITNLARLETTVACSGAITADAIPAIKQMGFASIVNLRVATEPGADVEKQAAAAKAAGLRYFHVPFDGKPDPKAAGAFLDAITTPGAEPAFIHCAGGNRAATMWLIKRLAVDRWDVDRATKEAQALGQTSAALRQFAVEYAQANPRK
jgi:uncharacterized protein (TIGR01244 family)